MEIQIIASSSMGNCYQVDDLLVEAGVSIRQIREALKYRLSDITGCLITHEHGDHAKGAKDLLKAGVDVYCSRGTAEALKLSGHRLHVVRAWEQFRLGDWSIKPFDLVHDTAEPFGFLLMKGCAKILFVTDTAYIKYRFEGLTHIMLAIDFDSEIMKANLACGSLPAEMAKRTMRNHMHLSTALDFFRANDMSKVQEIHLLHLSDGNSDEAKFKAEVEKITGRPIYVGRK